MRYLTKEAFPEFQEWLSIKQVLGLAVSDRQVAVADESGSAWTIYATNTRMATRLLDALAASGRKVWSWQAQTAAISLGRRYHVDPSSLDWLLDALTASAVVRPEQEVRKLDLPGTTVRKSPRSVPGKATRPSAAQEAVAVSRLVAQLHRIADRRTRLSVIESCRQEQVWRTRQALGWAVDLELLRTEMDLASSKQRGLARDFGIDLVDDSSPLRRASIHRWLAGHGISVVDRDGRPSLVRDDYNRVDVPTDTGAQLAWANFREARSVRSRLGKLDEIKRSLDRTGRLHANVHLRWTRTGRGTVIRPSLQNINRDLRPLLVADPGHELVSLDFSQVEPRVAAALSGCPALTAAVESGDFYSAIARRVWGDDAFDETGVVRSDRRDDSKKLILAVFYGKGARALAFDLKIAVEESQALLRAIWDSFPRLAEFDHQLKADVSAGKIAHTVSGRPVPLPSGGKTYAALNARVQSEAADLFVSALGRLSSVVPREYFYLGIHDEVVIHVPSNRTEWAKHALNSTMPTNLLGVPIRGEASVLGRSWRKA